jgi:pyruvate/2-oxoglutarate dehydrogenase complex dihydrolipoamide dehydrogenase (E3) component
MNVLKPDLCVIGAGSGGLSVAAIAASMGVPVVLVEKARMGGECLNNGCVPSKALIAAASHAFSTRHAAHFGIQTGSVSTDFSAVMNHVHNVIKAIAPNDSVERFTAMGVNVIQGEAEFTNAKTVRVGEHIIEARRYIIATGSKPAIPNIPGLSDIDYLTNETLFNLTSLPSHLLIVGAGPIGVEMAQAFRRLGAQVTLVSSSALLPREDPEMAAVIERSLVREGTNLHLNVKIARAERISTGPALVLQDGTRLEGTHLLVATGRSPTTEGLGLEAAGVIYDHKGIQVDKDLRTSNRKVYAIGDCAKGQPRFTHAANHQAGLVIRSALFRLPIRADKVPIPRVTYSDPELAAIGLNEAEAKERFGTIRILRSAMAENDRAQAHHTTQGHMKVITTKNGRIVGCSLAVSHAGELLAPWILAISKGLKVQDIAGLTLPYPTLSEISKRASVEYLKPAARHPATQAILRFLRRFG